MKVIVLGFVLAGTSFATLPVQNRITSGALAKLQSANPMVRLEKPADNEAKVARPDNQSILRDSTILNDGKNWTIVPIGAVVHIPENLKHRVNAEPAGTMVSWNDFLMANHAWITTCEVDFKQAAGQTEFPAERSAYWPKQNRVVVAVHQRGPISARLKTL
jgi:hypothetical protein